MAMQLNIQIDSEVLANTELTEISGRSRKDDQIAWLRSVGWKFSVNAIGAPIVGRWYTRMKLAGVELSDAVAPTVRKPDFSKVA